MAVTGGTSAQVRICESSGLFCLMVASSIRNCKASGSSQTLCGLECTSLVTSRHKMATSRNLKKKVKLL